MRHLIYRVRFAWHLHTRGGVPFRDAFNYPIDWNQLSYGDPIDDAEEEMSYWDGG